MTPLDMAFRFPSTSAAAQFWASAGRCREILRHLVYRWSAAMQKARGSTLQGLPMKNAIAIAFLASLLPFTAHAATLKFPSEAPIASITIPDSWKPEETDSGVQGTSADSAVYLSADVADSKSMDKVVSDAIDFLTKSGVNIDPATQKDTPVTEVNGMQMTTLEWDGKDQDGPVSVGLLFVQTAGDKALVVTYWGSKGDEDKHDAEVQAILASIKPAK
jgi:hypothetical protein